MKTAKEIEDEIWESHQKRRVLDLVGGCESHPYTMLRTDGSCPTCEKEVEVRAFQVMSEYSNARVMVAVNGDPRLLGTRKCKTCGAPIAPPHWYCAQHRKGKRGKTAKPGRPNRLRTYVRKGFQHGRWEVLSKSPVHAMDGKHERVRCRCVCGKEEWRRVDSFSTWFRKIHQKAGCSSVACRNRWVRELESKFTNPQELHEKRESKLRKEGYVK